MWKVTVLTLFKDFFNSPLNISLSKRSLEEKKWSFEAIDIRDFSKDKHNRVDDICYGGGSGMLIKPEVVHDALMHAISLYEKTPNIVYLSPKGSVFNQKTADSFIKSDGCIILCGRYEGIDERVIEYFKKNYEMIEISIGDFVLSCGEVASLVLIDACIRLLNLEQDAIVNESFRMDLLEHPQYTRPRVWNNMAVPDVLLSGHHENIKKWRESKALEITKKNRPDLLVKCHDSLKKD